MEQPMLRVFVREVVDGKLGGVLAGPVSYATDTGYIFPSVQAYESIALVTVDTRDVIAWGALESDYDGTFFTQASITLADYTITCMYVYEGVTFGRRYYWQLYTPEWELLPWLSYRLATSLQEGLVEYLDILGRKVKELALNGSHEALWEELEKWFNKENE